MLFRKSITSRLALLRAIEADVVRRLAEIGEPVPELEQALVQLRQWQAEIPRLVRRTVILSILLGVTLVGCVAMLVATFGSALTPLPVGGSLLAGAGALWRRRRVSAGLSPREVRVASRDLLFASVAGGVAGEIGRYFSGGIPAGAPTGVGWLALGAAGIGGMVGFIVSAGFGAGILLWLGVKIVGHLLRGDHAA